MVSSFTPFFKGLSDKHLGENENSTGILMFNSTNQTTLQEVGTPELQGVIAGDTGFPKKKPVS